MMSTSVTCQSSPIFVLQIIICNVSTCMSTWQTYAGIKTQVHLSHLPLPFNTLVSTRIDQLNPRANNTWGIDSLLAN